MPNVITSIKAEPVDHVRSLTARAGRRQAGRCLLEGASLIEQALQAGARLCFVLRTEQARAPVLDVLDEHGVPVHEVKETVLRQVFRTARPVNWVAVAEGPIISREVSDSADTVLVLDGIVDPGNLGTIVRTAVGLGVPDILCTDEDTDPTSRKVLDASRATVLRARLRQFPSGTATVRSLHEHGFAVLATSSWGERPNAVLGAHRRVALVVGNETHGVSAEVFDLADGLFRIPMHGPVESLNVGVAAGIGLYELTRHAQQ